MLLLLINLQLKCQSVRDWGIQVQIYLATWLAVSIAAFLAALNNLKAYLQDMTLRLTSASIPHLRCVPNKGVAAWTQKRT